jgi:hypothetical protein
MKIELYVEIMSKFLDFQISLIMIIAMTFQIERSEENGKT